MDGVIAINYTYVPPEYRTDNESLIQTVHGQRNYSYVCEQWRTQFDIRRTYMDSVQLIDSSFTYLSRIPYWPITDHGWSFNSDLYFGPNFTIPSSDQVGYAIHQTMYDLLKGQIGSDPWGQPLTDYHLGGTKLVEESVWPPRDGIQKPKENLASLVEELSRNVTLSLFSIKNLVYNQAEPDTEATMLPYELVFHYNKLALWLTYGISLLASLVAFLAGAVSFVINGLSMETFLTILTTTRGQHLDDLAAGSCLGAQPMSTETTEGESEVRGGLSYGTVFQFYFLFVCADKADEGGDI